MEILVNTDGGSRGNPGPSACGVVIGEPFNKKYSEYLGRKTNNEAEYASVILALRKIKSLVGKAKVEGVSVVVFMDSKLAVMQLSGKYKLKSENLFPLFIEIHNLKTEFLSIEYRHVFRENNKEADRMVNQELDRLI